MVGFLFLPVIDAIGEGPAFWIFGAICIAGFVERFVPETKGRSFAEIDSELRSRGGATAGPAVATD